MIYQKKNYGHRTSKIVKSRQSSSNGHLPYHLFILWLSARARAWRGMWVCVRSKDAQKQLARTSLSLYCIRNKKLADNLPANCKCFFFILFLSANYKFFSTTRASCFIGASKHSKTIKVGSLRPRAFKSFLEFVKPDKTLVLTADHKNLMMHIDIILSYCFR